MNINTLALNIDIKHSPFYLNEYLKPFIDLYIILKEQEVDCPFNLFHKYQFKNLSFFEYFIGFRYLNNELAYFFVSLYDNNEVTGFATYCKNDPRRFDLKDLGFFKPKKPLIVKSKNKAFPEIDDIESIGDNLKKAGLINTEYIQMKERYLSDRIY